MTAQVSVNTFLNSRTTLDAAGQSFIVADTGANINNYIANLASDPLILSILITDNVRLPVSISRLTSYGVAFGKIVNGFDIYDTGSAINGAFALLIQYVNSIGAMSVSSGAVSASVSQFFQYQRLLDKTVGGWKLSDYNAAILNQIGLLSGDGFITSVAASDAPTTISPALNSLYPEFFARWSTKLVITTTAVTTTTTATTTTPMKVYPGNVSKITTGGKSYPVVFGPAAACIITNPARPSDQGIAVAEPLVLNLLNGDPTTPGADNYTLMPGDTYYSNNVIATINATAATSGHKFSVVTIQPASVAVAQVGDFPPNAVTTKTTTIDSYLYQEYSDDDTLQAFVDSYNQITQDYVDTFNNLNLPIYINDNISGALLDWVGEGLYGYKRPFISNGRQYNIGMFNTYALNTMMYGHLTRVVARGQTVSSDDIYKRCLTWHLYKGDGKYFNVRWLKQRIMRWLFGENGADANMPTYQISVTFGVDNEVTITIIHSQSVLGNKNAMYNTFAFNRRRMNQFQVVVTPLAQLQYAALFKEAVETGVLELPFQYTYVVIV